jgi:methionyl-tRNA synthetase
MGHALEFVRADIIARYKKLQGFDVFFNTGTDEHGMKIYETAAKNGKTAQEFVDENFLRFKDSVKIFGLVNDIHYIRTTDSHHEKAAQEFWKRCADNGYIYKKNYSAKYCVGCEETKTDSELVNGECPIHPGRALETIEEENYFFKYSAFTDKLTEFYNKNPQFVVPDFRFNEIKAFVSRGLEDFSISRLKEKMPWGIPVPGDEAHVMYVWFDALTNYISTLGWPKTRADARSAELASEGNASFRPEGEDLFEKYWVHGTPTQYCGKDNLRFQSAMWQAMLMAAGVPNSHQIVINGFITADGGVKMSKTLGNVVNPKDIVDEYGTDALRFFLAKEVSSFEDSPFTAERFKASYNAHLANGLGNLVSRLMNMVVAYDVDITSVGAAHTVFDGALVDERLASFDIQGAMSTVWEAVTATNVLLQEKEPFKKIKTDPEGAKQDLIQAVQQLFDIAYMLEPFMPETAEKILASIERKEKPASLFARKD